MPWVPEMLFVQVLYLAFHEEWDIETTLKKSHAAGSAMMKIDSSSGNLPNIKKFIILKSDQLFEDLF